MDHFATLTRREQLVKSVLRIGQWTGGKFNLSPE